MSICIIGIDCATVDTRIGVATGVWADGSVEIERGIRCGRGVTAEDVVVEACQSAQGLVLLALGADRIARTAHAALTLLQRVRGRIGCDIPLAWEPGRPARGVSAIEVYPAATLIGWNIPPNRYKSTGDTSRRREILDSLRSVGVGFPQDARIFADSADVLDAALCVVGAADFLAGRVMPPPDRARAEREGWIWARRPLKNVSECPGCPHSGVVQNAAATKPDTSPR